MKTHLAPRTVVSTLQTPIFWTNPIDELFWPFTKDRLYTVKSCYRRIIEGKQTPRDKASSSSGTPKDFWNRIRGAIILEKLKHFM